MYIKVRSLLLANITIYNDIYSKNRRQNTPSPEYKRKNNHQTIKHEGKERESKIMDMMNRVMMNKIRSKESTERVWNDKHHDIRKSF